MAESRPRFQMQATGRPTDGSDNETGIKVNLIGKTLSMAEIKFQVECLLSKLPGGSQKQATGNKTWFCLSTGGKDEKRKRGSMDQEDGKNQNDKTRTKKNL